MRLFIIISIVCLLRISSCDVIVVTNSGPIRSTASLSPDVEAFLGIPFAEPPIGNLRFAKPVPKKPWIQIYDATSLPPPCAQIPSIPAYHFFGDISNMSEDCLYLNIWMPKYEAKDDLRPVIIYIHHGAFLYGSSNQKEFDGTHIASQDIVVVTINYRLGVLGFFLAYIEEADGNMAMYDQLMAIEWVSNNAKYFGGDPENIVLMGTSAGAFSVGAHMLSPLSKHFFKRVILQSGSILNPIQFGGNERLFKNSAQIATLAGCSNETVSLQNDPRSVVDCLKRRPVKVVLETQLILLKSKPTPLYFRSGDEFLPEDAALMLREGKFRRDVDVMLGTTVDEGCLFTFIALHEYFGKFGTLNPRISKSMAIALLKTTAALTGVPKDVIDDFLKLYEIQPKLGYQKLIADFIGDLGTICGNVFQADLLSLKGNPVYYYKFAFRPVLSPMAEWVQATHLDDVQYMFGNPYFENFTSEEVELSKLLIARLSAFAKTGSPNVPGEVPWKRYSYHNPLYLHIGQDGESLRLKPSNRCQIWRKLFRSEIDSNLVRVLSEQTLPVYNSGFISASGNSYVIFLASLCLAFTYRLDILRQFHLQKGSDWISC